MSTRLYLALIALLGLCALMLVYSRYQTRKLFIELEMAQTQTRQLETEWSQLQLEQSTLGKHARIEATARGELNMVHVTPSNTQFMMMKSR